MSSEGTPNSSGGSQESRQSVFSWSGNRQAPSKGPQKIRVTILCARSLVKRDIFRLPDPFVKVHVDGSGQSHVTEVSKNTLDPKWNVHYDLFVGLNDAITISVWNDKKVLNYFGSQSLVILFNNFIYRSIKVGKEPVSLVAFVSSTVQSVD